MFYTQVFRDNFFHADAHAGNIWVDAARKENPRFIALDFGIVGQLTAARPVLPGREFHGDLPARLPPHRRAARRGRLDAGDIRIDELEAAARSVCEPYFTRPLSEISLAEVMVKLFRTAQRYELTLQPQLILLQKTLLNIEGVGRLLDPEARHLGGGASRCSRSILRERYSPQALMAENSASACRN